MEQQVVSEKKKPGRPKKKILTTSIESHGIINKPHDDSNIVEFVYSNPTMLKKILQLYKHFEVSELDLLFTADSLCIVATDHLGKSIIFTEIYGKQMNVYYCANPVRICVKRVSLDKVMGVLSKNHHKVSIILREDYRSTMYIVVKDIEYNNESCYEIDVVLGRENFVSVDPTSDQQYPLQFTLAAKHFKLLINNVRQLSQTITLQKAGLDPIQFTYAKSNHINWVSVYNDEQKINLRSTIGEDDIFSVSVNIDYIRPFSNSNVGDEVTIAAHPTDKITFTTWLDKRGNTPTAMVKIFTEIKGA